jgi:galactose mutarotase-like enzyme
MDRHRIATAALSAEIDADGAELCSLRDAAGREFLWQALPAWPRHAPVLFPIVGRLAGDTLRHRGQSYRLTQHGFARDRRFEWTQREAAACRLSLSDDAQTRGLYPFVFRFEIAFAIDADALAITYAIENPGAENLPASMGAHPAFRWPLVDGVAKDAHSLTFDAPEPAPIRRVGGGLLLPHSEATPIEGRTLRLREDLFAADAVILDRPASRSVRFAAPGTATLEVSWHGFQQLGLWMKPGAAFLCIEPWCGYASPVGWDGEFTDKPGLLHIPPGGRVAATHRIRIIA